LKGWDKWSPEYSYDGDVNGTSSQILLAWCGERLALVFFLLQARSQVCSAGSEAASDLLHPSGFLNHFTFLDILGSYFLPHGCLWCQLVCLILVQFPVH
jgi:hypothetical protein